MTFSRAALLLTFLAAASSCITVEPGTEVELTVVDVSSAGAIAQWTTDRGYDVELDHLYLVLSEVSLVRCPEVAARSMLRELFGPAIARAHGFDASTGWAVSSVVAPLLDREPVSLAVLHPPANDYCAVRLSFAAAGDRTEREPSDVQMHGYSMHVSGSYSKLGAGAKHSFEYESTASSDTILPLVDDAGHPAVLSLSDENLRSKLRIELAYKHLFDGLTLFPGKFEPFADVVFSHASEHIAVVIAKDPD